MSIGGGIIEDDERSSTTGILDSYLFKVVFR